MSKKVMALIAHCSALIARHARARALALGLAVFLIVVLLGALGAFRGIEYYLVDARFLTRDRIRPPAVDESVMTIDWDERAIQFLGRWPWTWDRHARLLELLDFLEVRDAAIVDPIFSDPLDIAMPKGQAEQLAEDLAAALAANDTARTAALVPHHEADLAGMLARFGRGMLTADITIMDELEGGAIGNVAPGVAERFSSPLPHPGHTLRAALLRPPVGGLETAVAGIGFNWIALDPDGVVRHMPAVLEFHGRAWPSLAVVMAAQRFGCPPADIRYEPGRAITFPGASNLAGRDILIPVDAEGRMAINWIGPYRGRILHAPFMLLAQQFAYWRAKRALNAFEVMATDDLGQLQNNGAQLAFQEMINSHLCDPDDANSWSWTIVDGAVAEWMQKRNFTWNDYFDTYLQGADTGEIGYWRWQAVALNNLAARQLADSRTPDYAQLLSELNLPDTPFLRANFRQTLYFHRRGLLDEMRPLIFPAGEFREDDGSIRTLTPDMMKGKTVFIGLTATGLNALNPTPFDKRYQMLGMQPNAYNTIVTGQFLHETPAWLALALLFIYALAVTAWCLRVGAAGQIFGAGGLALAHIALSCVGFATRGWLLPVASPLAVILLSWGGAVFVRYLDAQRERRKVRGLFSTMVSPDVLRMLEANPERLALAGEKKDATMFSSDVSGFTTISEGVTAQELADILNIYLTPMSNIIMKYGGFIDKYEGDAIKASFGILPFDTEHPWKGVCAALEQQEELVAIQRLLQLKYGVRISARMGVNTGIVAAGNMGSEKKMQFTVMGHEVALAEEMEPINKLFESWVAMGPETEKRSRAMLEARRLDTVRMGPLRHPLEVYEPLGWRKDKYLAYWRGKPVPALWLESWRKMGPEKILGYVHYFAKKDLPDGPLARELKALLEDLSPRAVEMMQVHDALQIDEMRTVIARLAAAAGEGELQDQGIAAEYGKIAAETAATTEAWKKRLGEWRLILKRALDASLRLSGAAGEELLKQADALEKRCESYRKRIIFPEVTDQVAVKLAEHLKKLLAAGDAAAAGAGQEQRLAQLRAGVSERLERFAAELERPEKAEQFHEFMSDFCAVTEKKLQVRDIYARARERYLARDWDGAERLATEALAVIPGDGPSLKLIERAKRLRQTPPPADWDGVNDEEP